MWSVDIHYFGNVIDLDSFLNVQASSKSRSWIASTASIMVYQKLFIVFISLTRH